jgi:Spy/CpxP family protein refolding chaperone
VQQRRLVCLEKAKVISEYEKKSRAEDLMKLPSVKKPEPRKPKRRGSNMRVVLTSLLLLVSTTAIAQMPYAGMQTRPIKALSEQQISDLNAGRGMGLALAAELNGYPGPSHVLELADKLELSSDQRTQVQALFASMKAEAQPLGSKLIAQETELDKLFASRAITPDTLKASTTAIAITNGELRETHLKYHLSTAAILTPTQMQRYAELRGYGTDQPRHQHRH